MFRLRRTSAPVLPRPFQYLMPRTTPDEPTGEPEDVHAARGGVSLTEPIQMSERRPQNDNPGLTPPPPLSGANRTWDGPEAERLPLEAASQEAAVETVEHIEIIEYEIEECVTAQLLSPTTDAAASLDMMERRDFGKGAPKVSALHQSAEFAQEIAADKAPTTDIVHALGQTYRVRDIPWDDDVGQAAYQRLRAQVFVEQLGWDLPLTCDGREADRYDVGGHAISVHGVFGIDARGAEHLLAGVRIFRLRSWDDSMLLHEFADRAMVPEPVLHTLMERFPRARLLELTRLCVQPGRRWAVSTTPESVFDLAVARDLCYAHTYALAESTGRDQVVGIADGVYERVMRRSHFDYEVLHSVPHAQLANRSAYAIVLIDLAATIRAIQRHGDPLRADRMLARCQHPHQWLA